MNNATEIADKFLSAGELPDFKQIKTPIDDLVRELNFRKAQKL